MIQNTYTVNGEAPQKITGGSADIDMSTETGVKAGCKEYPIPLLNKITVMSKDGALSKSTSIYAGYKVVEQLLGEIVAAGNYNTGTPLLNTIISYGVFGMFEPAHYNKTDSWNNQKMDAKQINSLINVGQGVRICVKIEYTKNGGSAAVVYVPIARASDRFDGYPDTVVPFYEEIGVQSALAPAETVGSHYIQRPENRTWFESVLTQNILNVNLNEHITDPNTGENITVTLMAYIGSPPTADNTFPILPMSANSSTSITCQFQTYDPIIIIANKDAEYNPDEYSDSYGSVADYDTGTDYDTTISIGIVPPSE